MLRWTLTLRTHTHVSICAYTHTHTCSHDPNLQQTYCTVLNYLNLTLLQLLKCTVGWKHWGSAEVSSPLVHIYTLNSIWNTPVCKSILKTNYTSATVNSSAAASDTEENFLIQVQTSAQTIIEHLPTCGIVYRRSGIFITQFIFPLFCWCNLFYQVCFSCICYHMAMIYK